LKEFPELQAVNLCSSSAAQNTTILAGIYLHIPFCKQACNYCNFHFSTSLRYKDDVVEAITREIELEQGYLGGEPVHTIYFGGGTPSLLTADNLNSIFSSLHQHFTINEKAEITLEANPDDITVERLKEWKNRGINRLSIGVQSFFEEELRWMNRAHDAQQAIGNLQLAREEFDNITMDLIYGSPLLTDEMWRQNVEKAIGFDIPHLSCYALTVEEKTPLHKQILANKTSAVDPDKAAHQFLLLMQWLREKGYEHYEVSNFAKPGFRSRHNSSYWKGEKYLGLGPSAHSYNGVERRWNLANNTVYIKTVNEGKPARETEILTPSQQLNEYIMISLRTVEGMDLNIIELKWESGERQRIEKELQKLKQHSLITVSGSIVQLTDDGRLRADGIASDLFA